MGELWREMDARPRKTVAELERSDVPGAPGVYAFYHDGEAIYVGKASNLLNRVWKAHCGNNKSLRNSAFRRNVAEHLGIASPNDIYQARYKLTPDELTHVRSFIESCEVAWIEQPSDALAVALETGMKLENLPPLTKT